MLKYKVIVSDLDGTLLDSDIRLSGENKKAIKEYAAMGGLFVPSSGRTFSEMPDEVRNNPDIRYYIYANGTTVYDKVTGEKIYLCMGRELSNYVLDVLYSFDTNLTLRHDGISYVDSKQQGQEKWDYYDVWINHVEVVRNYAVYSYNFREEAYSRDNVEMIAAFFRNPDELENCKRILCDDDRLQVVQPCYNLLEIFECRAGKGNALLKLAEKTGISREEIIGVGDSDNDISMIRSAGLGLAMSNATDEVKSCTHKVICSNNEHAVRYILEHFIKDGNDVVG